MKLKKIEMQGFKSFKDKVILEFNHPIIGVVGPNGSGKSNISDAIRWVLGEQSAKSLRGTKMEDIIFAGTDKVKPLNVAQVSMTFDNREHWIPIDYKEVNITRRVFRTGESEYYINKNQCRLKDVRELFMDTGIGKEGYSIIGQGRIDEILSTKSEDRREIFEEASGISRYKYKKEESLKKLNKTTENLGRINDILSQQLDRIEFLEVEAKKAKKGIYLVDEIKKQEMYISKNESENLRKNIIENKVLLKEQLALLNKCKEDKNNYKNLLKKLKEELYDSEVKYNTNKNNLISYESVLYKTENDIRLREEGIKFYENDILRIQREIEKDTEKIKALNYKKDVFSKEILKLEQEVELISSNKFKLNNNIKRIKEGYTMSLKLVFILGSVISLLFIIFPKQIFSIFIDDPAVVKHGIL
ncbi:MAG: AAA family ATPase, partial [Tissierellia bacterium]|nr:AAA family ATPase [Tissierellia bacterium]